MIKFVNVSKTFEDGTHALNNINLEVKDGEFIYIVGKTGAGKSTLISLINTEILPTTGSILVGGKAVEKIKNSKVPYYRRKIGVVFQDFRLLPKKTVFENIAYALEVVDAPDSLIRSRVREVLKLVDLTDKYKTIPKHLSGGQRQRVAIARAIANKPVLLIADEPTGNLDPETSEGIITLLEKINKEEKTTIIMVTHDTVIVKNHPKRLIQLDGGNIAADVPAEECARRLADVAIEKPVEYHSDTEVIPLDVLVNEEIIEKRKTEELNLSSLENEK